MEETNTSMMAFSDNLIRKIFNSVSAHIAVIDETGAILEINDAWKRFSVENGLPESFDFRTINYLGICDAAAGHSGGDDAGAVSDGIRKVISREIDEFLHDYPCHSPNGPRWFYMRAVLVDGETPPRIIISHEDITGLKLAQEALKEHREQLEDKNQSLEELNTALKVLLQQREADKAEMEKTFLSNVKNLIRPYIGRLKESRLSEKDKTLVRIIEDHLDDIVSPLMRNIHNADIMLTPQEMQVAALVKDGRTTAQIADILFISETTVSFHRKNLRAKFGLTNRQANLRSFLLSMAGS